VVTLYVLGVPLHKRHAVKGLNLAALSKICVVGKAAVISEMQVDPDEDFHSLIGSKCEDRSYRGRGLNY
jgi:hypothetical protein